MPDYEVTDPRRGLTLTVTGPTPPSQVVLDQLFADAARQSAHMGPITADDTTPVTLGDLMDNPKLALQRMVSITKQSLSDPKVLIPAAVGLGIGALARASDYAPSMPSIPKLPNVRQAVGKAATAVGNSMDPDLVGLASPRAAAGIRYAQKVGQVLGKTNAPAAPPESVPAPPPTPAAPAPVATTPTAAATPAAPAPTSATTVPAEPTPSASVASLDDLALTKAEISQAVKWHDQGVPPKVIIQRIVESRQLTTQIGASTPDDAAFAISERNRTGKWRD